MAVVDRISCLTTSTYKTRGAQPLRFSRRGAEGISMWAMDSGQSVPNLWLDQDQVTTAPKDTTNEPNCLDFKFSKRPRNAYAADFKPPPICRTLRVGLPNTIFESGRPSTCFAQRWTVGSGDSGLKSRLTCARQRDLQQSIINLPPLAYTTVNWTKLLHMKNLSWPQVISECKGNIIRMLERCASSSMAEPASSVLERGISQLQRPPTEKSEIWAKVMNREFWPACARDFFPTSPAPTSPMRFVRVTSGGGGYGIKEGLLALDPEPVFSNQASQLIDRYARKRDSPTYDEQVFGSVIRPGDVIQFFAVFDEAQPSVDDEPLYSKEGRRNRGMRKVDIEAALGFGAQFKTPFSSHQAERPVQFPDGIQCLVAKHFGVESESGLWTRQDLVGAPGQAAVGALPFGNWWSTKLPTSTKIGWSRWRDLPRQTHAARYEWPAKDLRMEMPILRSFEKPSIRAARFGEKDGEE